MIKKLAALAATALFSLNASAGYVQYKFTEGPNGGLSGYIVQDENQAIADFKFLLSDPSTPLWDDFTFGAAFQWTNSEGCICIVSATTNFRANGPTNFRIEDGFGADHFTTLDVNFSRAKGGAFSYTATYFADFYSNFPPVVYSGTVKGLATKGEVDPILEYELDNYPYYFGDRIIPTYITQRDVPEPTSIALLALGAAGLAGVCRRRAGN